MAQQQQQQQQATMDFQKPLTYGKTLSFLTRKHDDNERQKREHKEAAYSKFLKTNVWKDIFLDAATQGFGGACITDFGSDPQAIEQQIRLIDFEGDPITISCRNSGFRIVVTWCGEHPMYSNKKIPFGHARMSVKEIF